MEEECQKYRAALQVEYVAARGSTINASIVIGGEF